MSLLPCPCCGHPARKRTETYGQNDTRGVIECANRECGLMMQYTIGEDRWNRRVGNQADAERLTWLIRTGSYGLVDHRSYFDPIPELQARVRESIDAMRAGES